MKNVHVFGSLYLAFQILIIVVLKFGIIGILSPKAIIGFPAIFAGLVGIWLLKEPNKKKSRGVKKREHQ
jgi:lipopolysaccharide export LptBFGC system permease protein LptF